MSGEVLSFSGMGFDSLEYVPPLSLQFHLQDKSKLFLALFNIMRNDFAVFLFSFIRHNCCRY